MDLRKEEGDEGLLWILPQKPVRGWSRLRSNTDLSLQGILESAERKRIGLGLCLQKKRGLVDQRCRTGRRRFSAFKISGCSKEVTDPIISQIDNLLVSAKTLKSIQLVISNPRGHGVFCPFTDTFFCEIAKNISYRQTLIPVGPFSQLKDLSSREKDLSSRPV